MSLNHYSSDIPETTTLWRTTHQQHHQHLLMEPTQNPSLSSWPSHSHVHDEDVDDDDDDNNIRHGATTTHTPEVDDQKEAMFEKPLTPSDVGKLNRLVIPKQHAEKYFPLGGESGVSLSFEDESGKCWRFRYSYWNSSQSYVLTKGWSRYVKDKRLDAGDVVFFQRHRSDSTRLFINWRRRHHAASTPAHVTRALPLHNATSAAAYRNINNNINNVGVGVGMEWTRGFYSAHPYPTHHCLHAGGASEADNKNKATSSVVGNSSSSSSSSSSRVLRLFGVNMEWQPDESGSSRPECSYVSSTQGTATQHHQFYGNYNHQPSYSSNHMQDVNQMRNRRG